LAGARRKEPPGCRGGRAARGAEGARAALATRLATVQALGCRCNGSRAWRGGAGRLPVEGDAELAGWPSKALAVASCQFCTLAAALLHRKISLIAGWLFLQLTPVVSPLSLACGVRVR